jgi:DNA-directed RNA polymerase specialized sigma24 family protein
LQPVQERSGHTLQPTALVHELYLRMIGGSPVDWQNRAHFLAVAARNFEAGFEPSRAVDRDVLEVDRGLDELEKVDERAADVIELRFFGGLMEAKTAEVLGTSESTVKPDWTFGRAWLLDYLRGEPKKSNKLRSL